MFAFKELADTSAPNSLSNYFRGKRMRLFEHLIQELPRPICILDVGGTVNFWELRGWTGRDDVRITLLNLTLERSPYKNMRAVQGSATDLSFAKPGEFDIAFSNSVIEHLFTWDNQQKMAR